MWVHNAMMPISNFKTAHKSDMVRNTPIDSMEYGNNIQRTSQTPWVNAPALLCSVHPGSTSLELTAVTESGVLARGYWE